MAIILFILLMNHGMEKGEMSLPVRRAMRIYEKGFGEE